MSLLDDSAVQGFLEEHPEWEREGDTLVRSYRFADFVEAMSFVTRVALLAEKAFHHPDIDIRWNAVTLRLSTHSAGGLTDQDLSMATAIGG